MGYEIGAVKYFLGMLTSVWGVITAYLFANGLLHPLDYIQAVGVVLENLSDPEEMILGLLNIVVTSPSEFARLVLIGLTLMTVLWYINSK
jgi:hypothetical protein